MGLLKKVSICVGIFSLVLGYIVHSPIPAEVPDQLLFQGLVDILSFSETLAQWSDKIGMKNRWWSYPGRLPLPLLYKTPDGMVTQHITLAGVDCVIITPKAFQMRKNSGPAVVYYHGGGWVFGDVGSYMPLLVTLAEETGYVVMSPEYRRSPEHVFPIPFEDSLNSTIEFISNADEFNVDPQKIALVGDSAGGNLAMSITVKLIELKESGIIEYEPAMQGLIYPILQMMNFRMPSYRQNEQFIFTPDLIPKFWLAYIGLNDRLDLSNLVINNGHVDHSNEEIRKISEWINAEKVPQEYKERPFGRNPVGAGKIEFPEVDERTQKFFTEKVLDTRIAPLMVNDAILSKLPKTHVLVCEYDSLRDDGIILAERLKSLDKDVTLQHLPNSLHATASVGASFHNSYYAKQNSIFFKAIKDHLD